MELEGSFRKRARTSGFVRRSSADGVDRLSSLPDCLLHTVMSFLKARQVVQTCVLSTRWRHLWRSVPRLDVDFDEFKKVPVSVSDNNDSGSGGDHNSGSDGDENSDSSDDGSSSSDSDTSEPDSRFHVRLINYVDRKEFKHFTKSKYKDWVRFEDFAVTLMRRCNIAQLDALRLDTDQIREPVFGDRVAAGWLRRAMKYFTPDRAIKLGSSSGSWLLKRLHLCHVHLDSHFVKRVSSVCCSLEDLELDDCNCQFQSITSDTLKNMVLRNCVWRHLSEIISPTLKALVIDGGSNINDSVLVIMAPALAYLHLDVDVYNFGGGVSLTEVPSIAKALIHIRCHKYCYSSTSSKLAGDQLKLLCSIFNSIDLVLSGVGAMVLGEEPKFQEFKNLRNLLLDDCDFSESFRTLVFFLRSSPILEKLTLRCCKFPNYSIKKKGMPIINNTSSSKMLLQSPKYSSKKEGTPILTSRLCEFPEYSNEKNGTHILKTGLYGLDLLCENLKVEIIYNDGYGPHLMELLLSISVNLSKNNVKLTKLN